MPRVAPPLRAPEPLAAPLAAGMDNNKQYVHAFDEGTTQQTASFTHQDSFALTESVDLYSHLAQPNHSVTARKPAHQDPIDLELAALMGGERAPRQPPRQALPPILGEHALPLRCSEVRAHGRRRW
jgi:hypothetical protein